eukprot:2643125-Pyramimonas_sp.AAC.1
MAKVNTPRGATESRHVVTETQRNKAYSHDGPIGRRTRGYILMMDRSDAGCGRDGLTKTAARRIVAHGVLL